MKGIIKAGLIVLVAVLTTGLVGGMIYFGSFAAPADAETGNPGPTLTGYQTIVMPISSVTTTTTGILKFKVPWPVRVLHMSAVGNAITGTVTLDLANSAGTSLLSSAMTLSTTLGDATLTATTANLSVTDETTLQLNTANTGTANNVTVLLGIKRL